MKQIINSYEKKEKAILNTHYWEMMKLKWTFREHLENTQVVDQKKNEDLDKISEEKNKLVALLQKQTERCIWMTEKMKENAERHKIGKN